MQAREPDLLRDSVSISLQNLLDRGGCVGRLDTDREGIWSGERG